VTLSKKELAAYDQIDGLQSTMFYTKITQIQFNDGTSLDILPNDIVILVGPNNCGKSQSLRDIYKIVGGGLNTVVVKDVVLDKGDLSELKQTLTEYSTTYNSSSSNNIQFKGYNYDIYGWQLSSYNSAKSLNDSIRNYLFSFLRTESRLAISNPPNAIDRKDPKTHPIHYLLFDKEYQRKVSQYFNEAFGYELTPDYVSRKEVSLCMGKTPTLPSGDAPKLMEQLEDILASYPKVHDQGDGMRSFAGIVLHLILKNYGVFLIDEPESFLHPPQARILGKVIGELLGSDRQAFIATHSEDVIKGMIEQCPDRIKVVRITREANVNHFAILSNERFTNIWNDPLLRHSNIMSSLFHQSVVLCESDADCRFYSIILDYQKTQEGHFSETLFIHCGGKQRMKQVVAALRSLSINFRCVPDIDVLNDKSVIKGLYEGCGGIWDADMESKYNCFVSNLNGGNDTISKAELKGRIDRLLDGFSNDKLTSGEVKKITSDLKLETKWNVLKNGGQVMIPAGQAKIAFNDLTAAFQKVNLFVVLVGELERFVTEEGGHGPVWVNNVLDHHKDFGSDIYRPVREFVSSWKL